jgi:hypothetical protein
MLRKGKSGNPDCFIERPELLRRVPPPKNNVTQVFLCFPQTPVTEIGKKVDEGLLHKKARKGHLKPVRLIKL